MGTLTRYRSAQQEAYIGKPKGNPKGKRKEQSNRTFFPLIAMRDPKSAHKPAVKIPSIPKISN